MRYTAIVESPLGEVRLASDGRALTGLWFVGQRYDGAGLGTDAQAAPDLPVFAEARGWLDAYLEGGRQVRPPAVALGGTPFQREVWGALQRIPYGATATYGDIARDLGRPAACRAVGAAVGRNRVSLIVPCHRAVGSGGSLTGYAGGLWRKRTLLALESDGIMTGEVADRAPGLVDALTDLWERSVRATHGFLPDGEVERLRAYVPGAIRATPRLFVARRAGVPVGFMGVDGVLLDMLFIDPGARGRGIGRLLLERGVQDAGVTELTVNEQNPQAVGFYRHMGFSVFDRTDTDDQGAPYPLLRMRLP